MTVMHNESAVGLVQTY